MKVLLDYKVEHYREKDTYIQIMINFIINGYGSVATNQYLHCLSLIDLPKIRI